MLCFFCSKNDHVTQNCDIYVSDAERKNLLKSKNCCSSCLSANSNNINDWCIKCRKSRKCYCCFSAAHHTVYCPDRLTVSNLFPPNIDQNLFSRFLQILTLEEKYFLAFSFPSILASHKLEPINIQYEEDIFLYNPESYTNADIISTEKCLMMTFITVDLNIIQQLLNSTIFRIKHLELRWTQISPTHILSLLSEKTKTFKFVGLTTVEKLKFRDILVKAPNLEGIALTYYDVEFGSSWPENILQLNNVPKLAIHFALSGVDFNVKSLSKLLKQKLVMAVFRIHISHDDRKNGSFRLFKKNLLKHFTPTSDKPKEEKFITIKFEYESGYCLRTPPVYYKPKKNSTINF